MLAFFSLVFAFVLVPSLFIVLFRIHVHASPVTPALTILIETFILWLER